MESLHQISGYFRGTFIKRAILVAVVLCNFYFNNAGLCCPSQRVCIIQTAVADLGIREVGGNNKGPEVEAILRHAGMPAGSNWCSAWVMRVLDRCNIKHSVNAWSPTSTPLSKCIYQRGKNQKFKAEPADVFSLYYSNLGRIGHTGFIAEYKGGDSVYTYEANTNAGGTRDSNSGDLIMKKRRPIKSIYRVAKWVD